MSRGYGSVQRQILEALAQRGPFGLWDSWSLARAIFGEHHTEADRSSVRRALRRLQADDVVVGRVNRSGHGHPILWELSAEGWHRR